MIVPDYDHFFRSPMRAYEPCGQGIIQPGVNLLADVFSSTLVSIDVTHE